MAKPNVSYEEMFNAAGLDFLKTMLNHFERKLHNVKVHLNNLNSQNDPLYLQNPENARKLNEYIQQDQKELKEYESTVNRLKTFIAIKENQQGGAKKKSKKSSKKRGAKKASKKASKKGSKKH